MTDPKKDTKERRLSVKLEIEQKQGYGMSDLATATLIVDLPADRDQIERSIGTMIDGMIAQVEIFHGKTTTLTADEA